MNPATQTRWLAAQIVFVALFSGPLPARAEIDLWPLFHRTETSTTILYPFYVREGSFLMAFPFYYRTNEGQDHHLLWPLIKFSEGRATRAAPFWFSGENRYTLVPFIHRTDDYTLWGLPPTYFREGKVKAIFPLFARGEHRFVAFPWYYRSRHPDEPKVDALIPVFLRWSDKDSRGTFLALYFDQEAPGIRRRWYMPFWMQSDSVGPNGSDSWLAVLWPIYERKESRDNDGLLLTRKRRFAIFSDSMDEDGSRTFSVFGLPILERL